MNRRYSHPSDEKKFNATRNMMRTTLMYERNMCNSGESNSTMYFTMFQEKE